MTIPNISDKSTSVYFAAFHALQCTVAIKREIFCGGKCTLYFGKSILYGDAAQGVCPDLGDAHIDEAANHAG